MSVEVGRSQWEKFWPGQEVPKTAIYGQFHDRNAKYAGVEHDRGLKKGDPFPRALNDHHYREK